jgi:hypothetical protein
MAISGPLWSRSIKSKNFIFLFNVCFIIKGADYENKFLFVDSKWFVLLLWQK